MPLSVWDAAWVPLQTALDGVVRAYDTDYNLRYKMHRVRQKVRGLDKTDDVATTRATYVAAYTAYRDERRGYTKVWYASVKNAKRSIVTARLALKTLGQTKTPTGEQWESSAVRELYDLCQILKARLGELSNHLTRDAYIEFLSYKDKLVTRVHECQYEIEKRERALPDVPIQADLATPAGQAKLQAKLFREELLREVTEPVVRSQVAFEKTLQLGERVQVRWPWGRDTFTAPGVLTKISGQSFTVALDVPVLLEGLAWQKGHKLRVPRLTGMGRQWTPHNGVFPV